jgi:membrane protein DedA with SNARE-associated domain
METLQSVFALVAEHVLAVVFCVFLVEAAGMPFPSRLVLILAATSLADARALLELVLAASAGAVIGDHVPYLGGKVAGGRLLALYCWLTLGSERCVETTLAYFRRFGAAAILLARFSASVRLFASALAGCGHIAYPRFLAYDVTGTVLYAAAWVTVGRVIGEHAGDLLQRQGATRLVVLVGPAAFAVLLAYRLWRRRRYGSARPEAVLTGLPAECAPQTRGARAVPTLR